MCMEDIRIARRTRRNLILADTVIPVRPSSILLPGNANRVALVFATNGFTYVDVYMSSTSNMGSGIWNNLLIGFQGPATPLPEATSILRIEQWGQLLTADIFLARDFGGTGLNVYELELMET